MITQDNLKEYFEYKDGNLFWKKQPSPQIKVGDVVGTINKRGYVQVKFLCKRFYAHRLIYFMFNGYFPQEVDHIDGNKTNNKIENLRAVTKSQNQHNARINVNNTSGVKGISWDKRCGKWKAQIAVNKKNYHLGRFDDFDLAKKTINQFREKYHQEYARYE